MKKKPFLYVPDQLSYAPPFLPLFSLTKEKEKADVIMFTGGEDVSPKLYGEEPGYYTSCNPERDKDEIELFDWARSHEVPMLGICRGAQFLCVQAGGKLVQHVTGHNTGTHAIKVLVKDIPGVNQDELVVMSSVHHQMMYPFRVQHEMIAIAAHALSNKYYGEPNDPEDPAKDDKLVEGVYCEPEIVYFPEIKALGIQGHPEYLSQQAFGVTLCNRIVKERLL